MSGPRNTAVVVFVTRLEGLELAQLCKRICWDDFVRMSVDRDEAELMKSAVEQLRRGLADTGFEPR